MIDDGLLIEVPSDLAKDAGFTVPVGILLEVWESCVAWTDEDSKRQVPKTKPGGCGTCSTSCESRRKAAAVIPFDSNCFEFHRMANAETPTTVELKAVIGPGDDLKPVITVMLPDQD